jgi:hypothetical protein
MYMYLYIYSYTYIYIYIYIRTQIFFLGPPKIKKQNSNLVKKNSNIHTNKDTNSISTKKKVTSNRSSNNNNDHSNNYNEKKMFDENLLRDAFLYTDAISKNSLLEEKNEVLFICAYLCVCVCMCVIMFVFLFVYMYMHCINACLCLSIIYIKLNIICTPISLHTYQYAYILKDIFRNVYILSSHLKSNPSIII